MATMYLATVLGWIFVILSIFVILRHDHMKSIMDDVTSHPGLFFVFALMTVILGLLIVTSHNLWVMGWPVVVTLIGWLVLISGLIRLVCAETAMKMGKAFVEEPIRIQITGAVVLLIGLFLLFHVYYLHH